MYDKLVDPFNKEYYNIILRALIILLEKNQHVEKINLNFKPVENSDTNLEDKVSKYSGYCILENSPVTLQSLDRLEYVKDTKKKKAFKAPELDNERGVKLFQKTHELNVLIYDRKAEFITRNKVLEAFLKLYHNKFEIEIESKTIFKVFNEFYDGIMESSDLNKKLQSFKFNIHDPFYEDNAEN